MMADDVNVILDSLRETHKPLEVWVDETVQPPNSSAAWISCRFVFELHKSDRKYVNIEPRSVLYVNIIIDTQKTKISCTSHSRDFLSIDYSMPSSFKLVNDFIEQSKQPKQTYLRRRRSETPNHVF